ncbi:MAG: hypothetical protein ACTHOM_04845 [Allomuricauda sp.]
MIDFVKMMITDYKSIKNIWTNPLLYFNNDLSKVNKHTGEIEKTKTKQFEDIEFNLVPNTPKNSKEGTERLEIRFKPHYWFNNSLHNANDFTPDQARATIQRFIKLFNIEHPEHFKVVNLEYGLNFLIDGYGKELISYPSYHQKDEFIRDLDHRYSKQKKSTKYLIVKLYSKGVQFPEHCPGETIRFEVKSKRSKRINPLGIYHLGDLLNTQPYQEMKADLIKNAKRVFIIDPYPIYNGLTKREENKLKEYSNPSFWYKELQKDRLSSFNEKKKTYLGYLDKTGNNINRKFVSSLEQKLNQLFDENRINSAPLEKNENRINSPMLKAENIRVSYSRICPITGMDITMQKEGSNLLSNTGLKHLEKTDKERFEELQNILLTGEYNKFERTVYDMMSKQIRNRYYNKRPIPEQTALF